MPLLWYRQNEKACRVLAREGGLDLFTPPSASPKRIGERNAAVWGVVGGSLGQCSNSREMFGPGQTSSSSRRVVRGMLLHFLLFFPLLHFGIPAMDVTDICLPPPGVDKIA